MNTRFFLAILVAGLLAAAGFAQSTSGTSGTVTVSVTDPSGAAIAGADLQIKDLDTNDVRNASTQATGSYTFPNLPFGRYQLTISAKGFQSQVFESVQVQTSRNTDLHASLKVGPTTETVTVSTAEAPLVEPESSTIADTIDTKQVVNLPIQNRSMYGLAFLVPGWASTGGPGSTTNSTGTFNGLPGGAIVGADFDGTPAISNRFRSGGYQYGTSVVQPRIEDIAEMTVQTAQLDLSGTGTSAMRINLVTRRGTNAYHGRVFEDFQNTDLNANSWLNNARHVVRNKVILNDFGFSVGGPIIKNKLFFFGTYAESISPNTYNATATVLSPGAQQGIFSYRDATGAIKSVNVLQLAGAAGFPSTVLPSTASQFSKINGVLNQGALTPTSDPNLSTLTWLVPGRNTSYFPALRFDYYLTQNVRLNVSYSQTKTNRFDANAPNWPGGIDPLDLTSSNSNNKIAGFGVDWVIRPTLINQFHAGFMYQYSIFDPENLGINLPAIQQQYWVYGNSLYDRAYPRQPISSYYPNLSFTDSVNWQRGSHSFTFGGGAWHEQDHYWNGPGGYPAWNFGIASGDPAGPALLAGLAGLSQTNQNNAQQLYAVLAGRISSVNIAGGGRPLDTKTGQYQPFGAYNLDEAQMGWNLFAQDRWHISQRLTLNYGLRWDIFNDDHDVNGGYSSPRSVADFWGPTPVGAIFQPGTLGGVQTPMFEAKVHAYKTQWVNPQPAIALAWAPKAGGVLGRIFPEGKTVLRTGWSLRNYLEGAQNFWAFASNQGSFFFQQGNLQADTSGAPGTFQPGSLTFGQPLPAYALFPQTWSPSLPFSTLSFSGNGFFAMNPNIRQPYVEQWNIGIQREIGSGSALEVRYVGNMGQHVWMSYNLNEVNIFENGFLGDFKNAQNNLAINRANGKGNTFANNGLAGQVPLPIFQSAFGNAAASAGYANSTFITYLNNGAAGSLANSLSRNQAFFCNMVGSINFTPCTAALGAGKPGAGYPINFWEVNPFTTGATLNYLDAAGHSNYNALQVEFRQRLTHGMQFNVNYSLGHAFTLGPQNGYQANVSSQPGTTSPIYLTDRNFRLNYAPSAFDIRHIVHASGTYDLPFGKGRRYLHGTLANEVLGGWTLGTIVIFQTGTPAAMSGGFNTVNNNDAGVVFNGATARDLQSTVGVYRGGNPWVTTFDPKFIAPSGAANSSSITPAATPGVWGYRPMIYGPHWLSADMSLNKSIPIRESLRLTLQGQFLNVFNHPTFNLGAIGIQGTNFGQATGGPTLPRRVEIRANIEF